MESFIIVHVDYKYCNFLRKFDSRVCYNYGEKRIRPFIGILFKVNDVEYFAPLSSLKLKHQKMKNSINFNNMIPVIKEAYELVNLETSLETVKDKNYYHMLKLQLLWLNLR